MNNTHANKILIIDDSQLILKSHAHTVRQATDADLLLVCSGEDGIATVTEHPDISLILLDMTMPGMDGLEFLERLQDYPAPICDIPVIIVSSSDDQEKMIAATSLGARSYVTKPLTLDEIMLALQDLPQEPGDTGDGDSKTVLVVEDSALTRTWISDTLSAAGYNVITAEDMWVSETVLRIRPTLILMDIGLGTANSGVIAARSLKKTIAQEIPIVFYSSQTESEMHKAIADSGADGFLKKSDDKQALVDAVNSFVGD